MKCPERARSSCVITGLVFEPDQPQSPPELQMGIVPFVVHRCPAQRGDRGAVDDPLVDRLALPVLPLPGVAEVAITRFLDTLRDPVHRPVEVSLCPLGCVRSPVLDLRQAVRVHRELERGRALGAERAAVDRAVRVPLDVDDLALPCADDLGTADRAARADAGDFTSPLDLEPGGSRLYRLQVEPQPGESARARCAKPAVELTSSEERVFRTHNTFLACPHQTLSLEMRASGLSARSFVKLLFKQCSCQVCAFFQLPT